MLTREDLKKVGVLDIAVAQVTDLLEQCKSATKFGSARVGIICTNSTGTDRSATEISTILLQEVLEPVYHEMQGKLITALEERLKGLQDELDTYIQVTPWGITSVTVGVKR